MKRYECKSCHKLLFKYNPVKIESNVLISGSVALGLMVLMCPRCKTTNSVGYQAYKGDWRFVYGAILSK